MLRLREVEAGYGSAQVLFGVSFAIEAGACVSLMGRNGMGKTTTVRTIMGQLPLRGAISGLHLMQPKHGRRSRDRPREPLCQR